MRGAERAAIVLAGVALFASLASTVHPWFDGRADASLYIATARSLAAGEGYTYLGSPFTLRPPGLSLLLAPLVAWRGVDFYAQHLLISVVGALGVVAFYFWLLPRVGWILALASCLLLWVNPTYQGLCNNSMSDVPALALLFVCFLLDRRAIREPSWRRELLLGLFVGLSCYFRSTAVLLLPAIALARLLERPVGGSWAWRAPLARAAVSVGVGGAIALSWVGYSSLATPSGSVDQTRIHSYLTFVLHEDAGDPDSAPLSLTEIASLPGKRLPRVLHGMGRRLTARPVTLDTLPHVAARAVCAALLLGSLLVLLVRRRGTPEIFATLSLLLLLVFTVAPRLVLPSYVVALAAAVEVLRGGATRALGQRRGPALLAALLVVLAWHDRDQTVGLDALEAEHNRRVQYFAELGPGLPRDARIATFKAFVYNVFLDQPSFSLHRAISRHGVEAGLERVVDDYAVDTVVLPADGGERQDRLQQVITRRAGSPQRVGAALVWRLPSAPQGPR